MCEVVCAERQATDRVEGDPCLLRQFEDCSTRQFQVRAIRQRSFSVDEVLTPLAGAQLYRLIEMEIPVLKHDLEQTALKLGQGGGSEVVVALGIEVKQRLGSHRVMPTPRATRSANDSAPSRVV
jgi:hypothetical protein